MPTQKDHGFLILHVPDDGRAIELFAGLSISHGGGGGGVTSGVRWVWRRWGWKFIYIITFLPALQLLLL